MTPLPSVARSAPIRWALLLWLVVAAVVAVRTVVVPDQHTIFPVLAGSSAHWWADRPLYADYAPLDFFRYPPAFAVAFTPMALLGSRAGGVLWELIGIGVFVLGLWRFLRDVAPSAWTPARQAAFLALGALGALRGLWNAQSNALAVGLLLLAAAALVRRRWWTAAAALAGSVLVKLTPLAPALLLCAPPAAPAVRPVRRVPASRAAAAVPDAAAGHRPRSLPRMVESSDGDGERALAGVPRRLDGVAGAARRCCTADSPCRRCGNRSIRGSTGPSSC